MFFSNWVGLYRSRFSLPSEPFSTLPAICVTGAGWLGFLAPKNTSECEEVDVKVGDLTLEEKLGIRLDSTGWISKATCMKR